MTAEAIGLAVLLLGMLLLLAKLIRIRWRLSQRLFIPSSLIAGGLALLLGPEVLGRVMSWFGVEWFADGGVFTANIIDVWSAIPGLLISVVFAALFLGFRLPKLSEAGRLAGPQVAFGITLGSGQYVIGLLLALLVLTPVFGLPPMSGALIEIGFEGGHGTAAGMGGTFEELGFAEGQDLALGLATVGLLSGIILGIILVNWGVRRGHTAALSLDSGPSVSEQRGIVERQQRSAAAILTVRPSSVEPLALHFGLIALAVGIGQLMLWGLQSLERLLWADRVEIFAFVPLFPLAMLGGVVVQFAIERFDRAEVVDRLMVERIQGFALDALIIAALGSLSLTAIADNLGPFVILALAGILWCVGAFLFLAPRMLPDYWFERGIADTGQSMGVTATGLILLRIADPELKTPAYQAFGYKQLILEPFFGGGLITAASLPLIAGFGPAPFLIGMSVLLVVSLLVGLLYLGRMRAPATATAVAAEFSPPNRGDDLT
ncbi:sodium:glutamate symporter [Spiractinospora alimapuensis]|uniref:sodium/glutamate symporter n=1 Tax=Spiractinospora alimapuensis TaxID=2820884 RepID=UPI001F3132BD|nr:sodium:glutamate symporter [Spiractinospora alimapuensis]QVQ52680.1 sodium:glutamate symporter [Spiractinospora alimapuensis]